jgi:hypothetical protein
MRRGPSANLGHSASDCLQQRRDTEDREHPLHVVGQNRKAHLGSHPIECPGQEVAATHPWFERREWVLNRLPADAHWNSLTSPSSNVGTTICGLIAYLGFIAQPKALTGERNTIAGHMIQMIEGAEFAGIPFSDIAAQMQITLAQSLLASVPWLSLAAGRPLRQHGQEALVK